MSVSRNSVKAVNRQGTKA